MNIFVLDLDPVKAAEFHNDKHVVKMIVESAQLLSTAHFLTGSHAEGMYKPTHKGHPCTKWLTVSVDNYDWTLKLFEALCSEYTHRYGRMHLTQSKVHKLLQNRPSIPSNGLTSFALAMPPHYKTDDPVESYRKYYLGDKRHMAKWKNRPVPEWWS